MSVTVPDINPGYVDHAGHIPHLPSGRVPKKDGAHDGVQSGPYGPYWGGGAISVISGRPGIRHDLFATTGKIIIRDGIEGTQHSILRMKTANGPVMAVSWVQSTNDEVVVFDRGFIKGTRNPFQGWRIRASNPILGGFAGDWGDTFMTYSDGWGIGGNSVAGRLRTVAGQLKFDSGGGTGFTYHLELGYTPGTYSNLLVPTGDWDWPAYP